MNVACATQPLQRYATASGVTPTAAGAEYRPTERDFIDAFYDALAALRRETMHSSHIMDIVGSRHFQKIVGLGDRAIPLIVHELREQPSFLFLALQEITGENPVPESAIGKPRAMAEAWLLWAERVLEC